MSIWAGVASTIAAITGLAALLAARYETKRRRLTEVIDLITEIKAAIDWGASAALRRDELQGRLRTRISRLDLPKARELARAQLRSEQPSSELAAEALAEARSSLDNLRFFS